MLKNWKCEFVEMHSSWLQKYENWRFADFIPKYQYVENLKIYELSRCTNSSKWQNQKMYIFDEIIQNRQNAKYMKTYVFNIYTEY